MMTPISPMLAADWRKAQAGDNPPAGPFIVQPKYDGWRCMIIAGRALARSGAEIRQPAAHEIAEGLDGLDGELIAGEPADPDCLEKTQAALRSSDPADGARLKFVAFDDISDPQAPFAERLAALTARDFSNHAFASRFIIAPAYECAGAGAVAKVERDIYALGYEGSIIRDPQAPYSAGRSSLSSGPLWKWKRNVDAEAEIISAVQFAGGKEKLGALRCRYDGVEFSIGNGFSSKDRVALWKDRARLPGRLVKFRCQAFTARGAPRAPEFIAFRDALDLDAPQAGNPPDTDEQAAANDNAGAYRFACYVVEPGRDGFYALARDVAGDYFIDGPYLSEQDAHEALRPDTLPEPSWTSRFLAKITAGAVRL